MRVVNRVILIGVDYKYKKISNMKTATTRIPLLIGLLLWTSLEIINLRVNYIYWCPFLVVMVIFVIAWFNLNSHSWLDKIIIWLIPIVNFLVWCGFLSIINSSLMRQLFIIIAAVSGWWYWRQALKEAMAKEITLGQWWRTVNIINALSVWLLAAILYGWQSFLGWSIWWLWLIWFLCSGLLLVADYYASRLNLITHWPIITAAWLILGQLFMAVYFLPSSNFVLAYLLLLAYYVFGQLSRDSILKINTKKRLRYQMATLALGLILVMGTAKWF